MDERRKIRVSGRPYDRSHLGDWPEGGTSGLQQNTRPEQKAARRVRRRGEVRGWILAIIAAAAAALLLRAFCFEIILVDGDSMMPTLITNERIGVEKISRYTALPERGDIIITRYPDMDGTFVKRTIGLPGETVEIRDSTVYINGVPLQEDYVTSEPYADMEPVLVPEDHVFVMGDNRAHSMDSRASYIGPVSRDAIIGHGVFVLWPFENIHMIS